MSYKLELIEKATKSVRYKVVATTKDGVSHQDFMDLVEEDGKWRIQRF